MYQACNGVSYNFLPDGRIQVGEEFPSYGLDSAQAKKISQLWADWGWHITKACQTYDVPVSWIVGIMGQESGGNPQACSPCVQPSCGFAPNCGGPCCAYGLMQFISRLAASYGVSDPTELQRDPALAIDLGVRHIGKMFHASPASPAAPGPDLIKIAAAYNAGSHKCRDYGSFGNGSQTQGDYVMIVVKYANLFVSLDLPSAQNLVEAGMGIGNAMILTFVLSSVAFFFADIHWGLLDRFWDKFSIGKPRY
jgi:hypothetical protein